jgi:hypothetical protein
MMNPFGARSSGSSNLKVPMMSKKSAAAIDINYQQKSPSTFKCFATSH